MLDVFVLKAFKIKKLHFYFSGIDIISLLSIPNIFTVGVKISIAANIIKFVNEDNVMPLSETKQV